MPSNLYLTYMTRAIASRIASNMIRQFGHEKRFALSLPNRDDLKLLASSFIEEHGCRVVWHADANKIAVRITDEDAASLRESLAVP